jgi:hypothetical protein
MRPFWMILSIIKRRSFLLKSILVIAMMIALPPACTPAGVEGVPLAKRQLSVQVSNLPLGAVADWLAGELRCGVFVEASLQNTIISYFNKGARLTEILDDLKGMAHFEYECSDHFIILFPPGTKGKIVGSFIYSTPSPS